MNLPNLITLFRFLAVIPFAACILRYNHSGNVSYYWAGLAIFALAAVSDGFDGFLARRLNARTRLGAILDPLADKLFLNCAIILLAAGIAGLYRFPLWFAFLVLGRDLLIVGGGLFIRLTRGKLEVAPTRLGKVTAVLQMTLVIWTLIQLPRPDLVLYLTAAFSAASGLVYLRVGISQLFPH